MAFLKINDYELPPCDRGVTIMVTSVVNSGRNINGVVVGQKVGRDQFKIDGLQWSWLTAKQWEEILTLLTDFFVNVTFTNPVTNKIQTIVMYCGDRTAEPYWLDSSGSPTHYRNCKVNLIDTGR